MPERPTAGIRDDARTGRNDRSRVAVLRERMRPEYVVAAVFVVGLFMDIMDATIVNVALPTIAQSFDVGIASVDWVVVGYLLSLALWVPASGWIGDRFGTKRTFLFALAVFTASSALCGIASSVPELIAFRVLQGVGGGMMTPVGTAMLFRAFPPERRAAASRILMLPTVIAPACGPILGGYLVDSWSWRWIFYVNVPVGIGAFAFGALFLREHREPGAGPFDLPGFLLSGFGLALTLYALDEGPSRGWSSSRVAVTGLVGITCFVALVFVELRKRQPLFALRLLDNRLFRSTNLVSIFGFGSFIALLFVLPLYLQQARGFSALESGLTTFPEAIGVLAATQLVGRIYGKVGPRRLMSGGLVIVALAITLLASTGSHTTLWAIRGCMFLAGCGMAFVFLPLQAATFATIELPDMGRASAIFNSQRQMAAALGVAVLATVLASQVGGTPAAGADQSSAFRVVFLVDAGIALVGALVALTIHDSDAANTMTVEIETEMIDYETSAPPIV
jgi:EmrB/QacA subfamily drug resistance transporter